MQTTNPNLYDPFCVKYPSVSSVTNTFFVRILLIFLGLFFIHPASLSQSSVTYHEVKRGETIYSISSAYAVTMDSIKAWNNLKSNTILVGSKLKVSSSNVAAQELRGLPPKKGNLYCIAIGVSIHDDIEIPTLLYARNDAREICKTLKSQEGLLYENVFTLEIINNPTRDSIIRAINNVSYQAIENDIIMVFCSSHAIMDENNMLCLVPKDYDMTEGTNALVVADFLRTLERAKCPKILTLDVCFAEAAAFNLIDAVNYLGSDFTRNLAIMVGSSSTEFGKESSRFGQGIFTQSILDGLKKGKADSQNGNTIITLPELASYCANYVAIETNNTQNATMPINFFGNRGIYIIPTSPKIKP